MEKLSSLTDPSQELVINGVRCLDLLHEGRTWHLGACTPAWRQEMPLLGADPPAEDLAGLEAKGIWLAPAGESRPLAVMCCGQGVVWPHMGRELYDSVPVARAAMDRIAAVAGWDVLSLLDEESVEVIGQTRWQQPYLFLLQYAQWEYLSSLGLKPSLFAGHSLGEFIALCLAGIVPPELAWYIMDSRSGQTARMEAFSSSDLGMMAVHAGEPVVSALLAGFPELYVSNYNTPTQVIVSGPRTVLIEARRVLRKRRVPAMMLNVTTAFHNPAMRVLENHTYLRLNELDFRETGHAPVISNMTTELYPPDKRVICQHISSIEARTVRWVECVQKMYTVHGIRQWVETGPQDTLCGLVKAIEPRALCCSVSRKGNELEAMRNAVARLYSLGYLDRGRMTLSAGNPVAPARKKTVTAQPGPAPVEEGFLDEVMDVVAGTLSLDRETLRPDLDMRHDLGLRSSRFPLLLQDIEQHFGITIGFGDMLNVLTISDFARALDLILHPEKKEHKESGVHARPAAGALRRYALRSESPGHWLAVPAVLDPEAEGLPLRRGDSVVIIGNMPPSSPLYSALAAEGCRCYFIVPSITPLDRRMLCEPLRGLTSVAEVFTAETPAEVEAALEAILKRAPETDGLISTTMTPDRAAFAAIQDMAARLSPRWRMVLCPRPAPEEELAEALRLLHGCVTTSPVPIRAVMISPEEMRSGYLLSSLSAGDMLRRECSCSEEPCVLWTRHAAGGKTLQFVPPVTQAQRTGVRELSGRYPLIFPAEDPEGHRGTQPFTGMCHFSPIADGMLAEYPAGPDGRRRVPVSYLLEAMLEGARQNLPWLVPVCLADMRFPAPVELPEGVTRECRLSATTSAWLLKSGQLTRYCPVSVQARDLTRDGRRKMTYSDVCSSVVLLARKPEPIIPLWKSAFAGIPAAQLAVPEVPIRHFLASRSIPRVWRFLRSWERLPETETIPAWAGHIFLPPERSVRSMYAACQYPAVLLEGVLQFLRAILPEAVCGGESGLPSQAATGIAENISAELTGITLIHFDARTAGGAYTLEVRRSYLTPGDIQFDVQAFDAMGRLVLTCNTVEYLFVCG